MYIYKKHIRHLKINKLLPILPHPLIPLLYTTHIMLNQSICKTLIISLFNAFSYYWFGSKGNKRRNFVSTIINLFSLLQIIHVHHMSIYLFSYRADFSFVSTIFIISLSLGFVTEQLIINSTVEGES